MVVRPEQLMNLLKGVNYYPKRYKKMYSGFLRKGRKRSGDILSVAEIGDVNTMPTLKWRSAGHVVQGKGDDRLGRSSALETKRTADRIKTSERPSD